MSFARTRPIPSNLTYLARHIPFFPFLSPSVLFLCGSSGGIRVCQNIWWWEGGGDPPLLWRSNVYSTDSGILQFVTREA